MKTRIAWPYGATAVTVAITEAIEHREQSGDLTGANRLRAVLAHQTAGDPYARVAHDMMKTTHVIVGDHDPEPRSR